MKKSDFLHLAIADARKSNHHFGAIIVKNGKVIALAGKRPAGDARFHAETQAIFRACEKLKTKTLEGCVLYSTCEPCIMCFYLTWITGIKSVVYGASLKDAINLGFPEVNVTTAVLNKKSGNKITFKRGVLRKECVQLLTRK